LNRRDNCFEHASAIGHHIMIAEAEDTKTPRFNRGGTRGICLFLIVGKVLSAVQFNHQFSRVAQEIGNVAFNWDLTPEANSKQAMIAQFRPQDSLGVGRILSKSASVGS
jgi:hypothetical protein